jgi:transcription initiation factor TFIIF subunit beta
MSDEAAKHLETARADRSVWLMKCPPVVSQAWQGASSSSGEANPNPVVAKVVLSLNPLSAAEPTLQFKMEMAQTRETSTCNLPKSYSLNMFKDFVPMCVFSENGQGKHSCEGKVEHKFDMEPHKDNLINYAKLCRERTQKSMVKTRKVQVLDNDHGMSMRPMPGMVGLITTGGSKEKRKPTPTKPSDVKRTRRDRRELENIIFKLFEKQPNWALKALVQETDQPEQFLKEILNDLCMYNKRGPNQGTHELKPEYKKSSEEAAAADAS